MISIVVHEEDGSGSHKKPLEGPLRMALCKASLCSSLSVNANCLIIGLQQVSSSWDQDMGSRNIFKGSVIRHYVSFLGEVRMSLHPEIQIRTLERPSADIRNIADSPRAVASSGLRSRDQA